jgi:hypothetical protein
MGRPLNKKYFGNRNIGSTSTTSDDYGIGGEGIASINWASLGTFRTTPVGLALPAPTLPGGVQASWSAIKYRVNGVVTSAGKTNLAVGWTGTSSFFPGMVAVVTSVSGSNAVFSVLPVDGGSQGSNLNSVPNSGNTNTIVLTKTAGGGTATTFTVDVNLQIVAMSIVEQGSGYTGSETFTVTVAGGMDPPAGTLVLTTDSGSVGSSTNQENAIIAYAWIAGKREVVDIVKQSGSSRYTITGADGTVYRAKLKGTGDASADGEMDIYATDDNNNTYYVTKLTERRAYLTRKSGGSNYVYESGTSAPWSFNAASGIYVKVNNA